MFFRHDVIDNFLLDNDLNELISIDLKKVHDKEKKVYHNRIFKNGVIESSCIKKETILRLHENYHSMAINILKKFAPKKIDLYEYSDFHIVISGKNHSFPIHSDTPNKLLSGVIYLKPDTNTGTTLYSSDKKETLEIKWKKNRALFFSRTENTPHSYKSDGVSNRVTLIYNLMTTDIKGVCKIEKKFYPFILIKEKINKILSKFSN
tara:strand:+ start:128 stop:745 length:618 start_codon:yes stop_codon:yes gene_type:complete